MVKLVILICFRLLPEYTTHLDTILMKKQRSGKQIGQWNLQDKLKMFIDNCWF